jgi:methionyl aminopeptidase
MIYYKTSAEIELMRKSALLVGDTIALVARHIKPGITTRELDSIAEDFIRSKGASPSFKGFHDYPFATCISVNDAVVHGFPGDEPLKEGDMISVDIGVYMNGYHGDSAYTLAIGDPGADVLDLMKYTKESLLVGISKAISGNRIGDISHAIQEHTEKKKGYGIVKELVGHGLGKNLHEEPQIPNYGKRGSGAKLKEGLVIAIEPMVNLGRREVKTDSDGWTVRTKDGKPSAHYEHTVAIAKNNADVLSSFAEIEKAERENTYLNSSYYN